MRGRSSSSSKQGKKIIRIGVSMEKDKVDKVKTEPHLSGAYIRSLVKHLTTTRPKDPLEAGNVNINGEIFGDQHNMKQESPPPPSPSPPPPPPPQIKKQVRRRQHTSRPYQERLLNMAEARREIVTALKFHRASMKQQEATTFTTTTTTATAATALPHYWAIPTIPPPPLPPLYQENLNFPLPNQTLGLNLNFQDFKNLDTNLYQNPLSIPSLSSSSSSSSSSSTSSSAAISAGETAPEEVGAGGLHHAMDDEEIEEIKSLGEKHQMEWNDTVNLVMSARWFKFLKSMEIGQEDGTIDTQKDDCYYGFNQFDQIMEFPPWLINANEQQQLHDHFSDDYLQDPALSCMDIGEIEGMDDGEWLA